jgi:hypothetical protein
MASTGFTLAGAGANVTGVGTEAWANPGNITAADDTYASGAAAAKDEQMNYLKGSSFGFSIPAGSRIDGIELRIQAKSTIGIAKLTHAIVGKSDSTLGSDLISTDVTISSTEGDYTYGSSTEKWGLTWTVDDINASTFQGMISANASNFAGTADDPVVDAMWINVHYTPPLTASTGSFVLTGKAAALSVSVPASAGSFALTGKDATLSRTIAGYMLAGAAGAYTLTGVAAALSRTWALIGGAGSFTLTGVAAALTLSRAILASPRAFTLTGNAATLLTTQLLDGEAGAFALTGQDAALRAQRLLLASPAAFALTGRDAALVHGLTLASNAVAFALNGQSAALIATRLMGEVPASFILTGQNAALVTSLLGTKGEFTLTGNGAALIVARVLAEAAGSFELTGNAATLHLERLIVCATAQFILNGIAVRLAWSGATSKTFGLLDKPPNSKMANAKTGIINHEWDSFFKGLTDRLNDINPNSRYR